MNGDYRYEWCIVRYGRFRGFRGIVAQIKSPSISLPARHSSVAFQPTKRPNIPIRQVILIGKSSLSTDYVLIVTSHARSRRSSFWIRPLGFSPT